MRGEIGVLNVGAGDTKLSFNSDDPAEVLRAGRIVRDMLRRGYALLVEVERGGVKKYERALDFDETRSEYIIADLDRQTYTGDADAAQETEAPKASRRGRRSLPATETRAVAVAPTAGG